MVDDIELSLYIVKIREDLTKRYEYAKEMSEVYPEDKSVMTELKESSMRLIAFERLIELAENLIEKTNNLVDRILKDSDPEDDKKNNLN